MSTPIKMPDLGTAVESFALVAWLKQEGDTIQIGEPLCEVEADKTTVIVDAEVEGVLLQQMIAVDSEFQAGAILGHIGEPGEQVMDGGDA